MDDERVDFVGPFESHFVVVGGRQVPFLHARPLDGGRIDLTLDRRFGVELSVAEADRIIPFLAHAIAVGMGYACHPDRTEKARKRPPFPRVTPLI